MSVLKRSQEGDAGPHQGYRGTVLSGPSAGVTRGSSQPHADPPPAVSPQFSLLATLPAPTGGDTLTETVFVQNECGGRARSRQATGGSRARQRFCGVRGLTRRPPGPCQLRLCAVRAQCVPAVARHAVREPLFKNSWLVKQTWTSAGMGGIPEDSDVVRLGRNPGLCVFNRSAP